MCLSGSLMYLAVGIPLGLGVHFAVLWFTYEARGLSFVMSQSIATFVAMVFNYWLNNMITYRDQRLTGARFVYGFFSFAVICSVGALSNIGVASFLFVEDRSWWLAGIVGVVLGTVWNYAMSSVFTWRVKPVDTKVVSEE